MSIKYHVISANLLTWQSYLWGQRKCHEMREECHNSQVDSLGNPAMTLPTKSVLIIINIHHMPMKQCVREFRSAMCCFAYVPWKHKSETPHWDWPQRAITVCSKKSWSLTVTHQIIFQIIILGPQWLWHTTYPTLGQCNEILQELLPMLLFIEVYTCYEYLFQWYIILQQ